MRTIDLIKTGALLLLAATLISCEATSPATTRTTKTTSATKRTTTTTTTKTSSAPIGAKRVGTNF